MKSEILELSHREILHPRLKGMKLNLSEYGFANLYLFRHFHQYEVLFDRDEVFVRGVTYDGGTYIMPTRDLREYDAAYVRELMKHANFLFPLPEEWLPLFPEEQFTASSYEGDTDYVYTTEKLQTYAGRKLHKKRNLLKQFHQSYQSEIHPLTDDRMDDAHEVLTRWSQYTDTPLAQTDYSACKEALFLMRELELCGGIFYADGEPAALLMGEELREDTWVIHFAKADIKFKGVYQFLFNTVAQILPGRYMWVNFEQDLGSPTLRQAKSSYYPDMLLQKYRISLR